MGHCCLRFVYLRLMVFGTMRKDCRPSVEPIVIVPYDSEWPKKFETEKIAIQRALGAVVIEVHHIGSTAVSGLAAKPIIDILVAVESLDDRPAFERGLSVLGYVNTPHDDDANRLCYGRGAPSAYHVHVVRLNSWTYWRHIIFRDILISSPDVRSDYERLKMELATRFRGNREAYTDGKGAFIERTVAQEVRGK